MLKNAAYSMDHLSSSSQTHLNFLSWQNLKQVKEGLSEYGMGWDEIGDWKGS